jgi:hypothetical protein
MKVDGRRRAVGGVGAGMARCTALVGEDAYPHSSSQARVAKTRLARKSPDRLQK